LRVVFGLGWSDKRCHHRFASGVVEVWGGLGWIRLPTPPLATGPPPSEKEWGTPPGGRRPPDLAAATESPSEGTGARRLTEACSVKSTPAAAHKGVTVGYQGGFDRFNDPSAGSPRLFHQWNATGSLGSGLVRPFIPRLPFGRAGLYLKAPVNDWRPTAT
jgi:hypothetical protein